MESGIYTHVLMAVLIAIAGGIGYLVALGAKEAIGRIKDQRLRLWVDNLVRAAAQKIPDKSERYRWVAGRLVGKFKWLKEDDVEELIEAAVYRLKQEMTVSNAPQVIKLPTVITTSEGESLEEYKAKLEQTGTVSADTACG